MSSNASSSVWFWYWLMRIHRYWTGIQEPPFNRYITRAVRSAMSPGDTLTDWTDRSLPSDILARVDNQSGKVRKHDALRHRGNIVRLELLYRYGGVWLDHDLLPLQRLSSLPQPSTAAVALRQRCSCFMSFPAAHSALQDVLAAIEAAPLSNTATSMEVSGERLLNRMLGDDVKHLLLPMDAAGRPIRRGSPWAVHLWNTG